MKNIINKIAILLLIPQVLYCMSLDKATFQVGQRFFNQKLYTEAELRFLDIVRKFPDSDYYRQSLFYLGQTYAFQGNYKAALQYYKLLLNKSQTIKDRQKALLGVAKSWLQLGAYDKSAQFYSFFASEYPESEYAPVSLYFAGISREREDNTKGAIEKYRSLISLYPETEYYGKAIEKLALLESNTPEELFAVASKKNNNTQSKASIGNEELFADDQFNIDEIPGFNSTDFRAQALNVQPIAAPPTIITQVILQQQPSVITQTLPPTIITQKIVEYITQQAVPSIEKIEQTVSQGISNISSATPQVSNKLQQLIDSAVVLLSNNQYMPVDNAAQRKHKEELEAYKKMWEQEFKTKLKDQELQEAQDNIKNLLTLTETKAQVLAVKEADLAGKQNQINSSIYKELKKIKEEQQASSYNSPPSFTVLKTNFVTITNNVSTSSSNQNNTVNQTNSNVSTNQALTNENSGNTNSLYLEDIYNEQDTYVEEGDQVYYE